MNKGLKLALGMLAGFFGLTLLHIWLNIGFERFNFMQAGGAHKQTFRVGFLPVT
jgi:hypothetical protein